MTTKTNLLTDGADGAMVASDWTRLLLGEEAKQRSLLAEGGEVESTFTRDVFSALYGLDSRNEAAPAWADRLLGAVQDHDQWASSSAMARGDAWACGLATQALVAECRDAVRDVADAQKRAEDLAKKETEEEDAKQRARYADAAKRAAEALERAVTRLSNAAGAVLEAAARETGEILEAVRVVGRAAGKTDEGATASHVRLQNALKRSMERSPKLAQIARLAGRMAASGAARARRRDSHGHEETVGTTLGGLDDLARVLPVELLLAGDDATEATLARKLLERQALAYEVRGTEPEQRGPVVVLVDASSSMEGARTAWAHAAALAIVLRARSEKRAAVVADFTMGAATIATYLPRETSADFGWVGRCRGGGTSIGNALKYAGDVIDKLPAFKRADVVLVTDGEDLGYEHVVDDLRGRGIEVHAVLIGTAREVPGAASSVRVSDATITSNRFDDAVDLFAL